MFRAGKYEFPLGKRTYVMGILNCTPDSFSDGGLYNSPEAAVEHALRMQEQGADIIDIGANSTRPDAIILSGEEEKKRLLPILEAVRKAVSVAVSVDTFYPVCAEAALLTGADIINDISGVFNSDMAELAKKYGSGYVVTHNPCGAGVTAEYPDGVVNEIRRFFDDSLRLAKECGLPESSLCLDPGIGFSKAYKDNLEILRDADKLKTSGVALLFAGSRKRFIGTASGVEDSRLRDSGTVAAHTAAIAGGADIIRVHDVAAAVQGARVADAIYREG